MGALTARERVVVQLIAEGHSIACIVARAVAYRCLSHVRCPTCPMGQLADTRRDGPEQKNVSCDVPYSPRVHASPAPVLLENQTMH